MKVLLKEVPERYILRVDEIFTSKKNVNITNMLIPELLNSLAPRFTPTRKQVRNWLGTLYRHQRERYLKKNSEKITADNQRIHINSRLSEV